MRTTILVIGFIFVAGSTLALETDSNDLALALSGDASVRLAEKDGRLIGGVAAAAKADADTVYLLGGPDRLDGKFETATGSPEWHGWMHEDPTAAECMWQVSEFGAISGALSAWCGTYFDDDPGYGNYWNQQLIFRHQVNDPGVATMVQWSALLQNDTEPNYDYTYFSVNRGGIWEDLHEVDDEQFQSVNLAFAVEPGDYVGSAGDEIQIRIQVLSDQSYSDQDDLWDTDGACQVDDIEVRVDGDVVSFEDCEDGILDDWECFSPFVGDFAALYDGLRDLDPCRENSSVQVAFIDDGVVVPGTGGTPCTTWCYGPDGYIVNNSGGLAGPGYNLFNRLSTPVLDVPAGMTGVIVGQDFYIHEELGDEDTWPGVVHAFEVRSTADPVAEPIESQPWRWPGDLWYGGPIYRRHVENLAALLEPGFVQVQLSISVVDWDAWHGTDGTPAPYLDNVSVLAYAAAGPHLESVDWYQAQDAFPASGDLDLSDLARNSVRFDAATGDDFLTYKAVANRPGSALLGPPVMHVRMRSNPLFDGVRELPEGFVSEGGLVLGAVIADSVFNSNNPPEPIPDRYHFDLPDTGFFFPGDVIHYYVEVQDQMAGDVGTTHLPADTTGFTDFAVCTPFRHDMRVRALPTLFSANPGDQPGILFYADAGWTESRWHHALQGLGYRAGVDYDWYLTKAGSSDQANSLGHAATSALLDGYSTLLSSSGHYYYALTTEDVLLLENWFDRGEKHALLTGDDLVRALAEGDSYQVAFLNNHLGVEYVSDSFTDLIGNQVAPRVRTMSGNGMIAQIDEWTAYGGCPTSAAMDAIQATGSTVRLAEFLDPNGNGDVSPLAAVTYHLDEPSGAEVVVFPYDLARVTTAPGWTPPAGMVGLASRAIILDDLLAVFGEQGNSPPIAAPDVGRFAVLVAPNPFNPRTTIVLNMPRARDAVVKIYNVRGERVRTLHQGHLAAGRHELIWDGGTDGGAAAASGVYFCETRAAGQTDVTKITLVR